MPIKQELFDKIATFEQAGHSPDEILAGLEASNNYPDIAQKIKTFREIGHSTDEIYQGLKITPVEQSKGFMGKVGDIVKPIPALAAANVVEAGAGIADIFGREETAKKLREDVGIVRKQVQEELPVEPGSWSEAGRSALTSIYGQAPAMAVGMFTGGTTLPLTTLGIQAGLQKTSELTEGGMSKPTAIVGGAVSGLAEALTEKIPFDTLFKKQGLSTGKKLVKMFFFEQLGEQAATAVNDAIDKVTIRPDMSMDDYIRDVKATAKATLIQTGLMSPLTAMERREEAKPPIEEKKATPPTDEKKTDTFAAGKESIPPPPSTIERPGILERAASILSELPTEEAARRETEAERFVRARGAPSIADLGIKGFGYGEVVLEKKGEVKPQQREIQQPGYGEIYAGPEAVAPEKQPIDLTDIAGLPKEVAERIVQEQTVLPPSLQERAKAIEAAGLTKAEKESLYDDLFAQAKQYRATSKPGWIPGDIAQREAVKQAGPVEEGGRGETGGGREVQAHEGDIVRPAEAEVVSGNFVKEGVIQNVEETSKEGGQEGREVAPIVPKAAGPSETAAPLTKPEPTDITTKAGNPFPSETNARNSARLRKLDKEGYAPVQVDGGWVLRKTDQVADAGKPIEAAPAQKESPDETVTPPTEKAAGEDVYGNTDRLLKEGGYQKAGIQPRSEKGEANLYKKGYRPYLWDKETNTLKLHGLGVWAKSPNVEKVTAEGLRKQLTAEPLGNGDYAVSLNGKHIHTIAASREQDAIEQTNILPKDVERAKASKAPEVAEASKTRTPTEQISSWVADKLDKGESFNRLQLQQFANEAYGGKASEGKFTPKDMFDAMEAGVNKTIMEVIPAEAITTEIPFEAYNTIDAIRSNILDKLPSQHGSRTDEQDEFQQFSTPPDLAYTMAWAAHINPKDTVFEPSAGIGGLASFAKNAGAKVIVNEFSPRRAEILKGMGFDSVHTENAEQLHNILPDEVKPSVVLMNPPFSSTAGRVKGERSSLNVLTHLDQALKRLEPDGRLVALIGKGRFKDAKAITDWFKNVQQEYNLRAIIDISGKGYQKYGTTYDNRIVVIDKDGPTSKPVIKGAVEDVKDAIPLLKEVRDDRPEQSAGEPAGKEIAQGGGTVAEPRRPVRPATDGVVSGQPGVSSERGEQPGKVSKAGPDKRSGKPDVGSPSSSDELSGDRGNGTAGQPGGGGGNADRATELSDVGGRQPNGLPKDTTLSEGLRVRAAKETTHDDKISDSVFETYKPAVSIEGAKPHPGKLVQSAAMGSVEPPKPTYSPKLSDNIVKKGLLSDAQLESAVYAGQSHNDLLPDGQRKGYFIGDGTGVGKGREISGIIMDNFNQGRNKAIWISEKPALIHDAVRDWTGIGGAGEKIINHGKTKVNTDLAAKDGVVFTTYKLLSSGSKLGADNAFQGKEGEPSRFGQILRWVGPDYDGVIVFDEAHNMQNAISVKGVRGATKPSLQAMSGVELQRKLPNARVVYVSATGATEVKNLAYAERLGLWGEGSPFPSKVDFITDIEKGGLAAMEVVARDMKALGKYNARSLSYDGVTYGRLEHKLDPGQREIYDTLASSWQLVLRNVNKALEETGQKSDPKAKGNALGKFWGTHQRFFNQVITSLQMPSVIEDVRAKLKEGKSAVLQLVNTNEAGLDKQLKKIDSADKETELEDLDITPREALMQYVEKAFPTQQYEEYVDQDGQKRMRPVVDSSGNPVQNREAVEMRERLLDQLGSIKVPDGPLEHLINAFGPDAVAEVTGRTKRVVRVNGKNELQTRNSNLAIKEANEFQDGKRRILVFSDAGSTGRSFHSDLNAENQEQRVHYLVQPGWRADKAVQGFGRTHRTNEANQPHYALVTTDLSGQKRFLSSIARRLDQLGAMTKGQRNTASQGLFSEKDNLESKYATAALNQLVDELSRGKVVNGIDLHTFMEQLGFNDLLDKSGNINETKMPDTPKFLNRILSMEIDPQNRVFEAFSERLEKNIEKAVADGTLDTGLENYRADKVAVKEENTVYKHPETGAETKHINFEAQHKIEFLPFEEAKRGDRKFEGFYQNKQSGVIWAAKNYGTKTTDTGRVLNEYKLSGPVAHRHQIVDETRFNEDHWDKVSEETAKAYWDKTIKDAPKYRKEDVHLISGALLPIWDRLPQDKTRVMRVQTDDGKRFIGRLIHENDLNNTLKNLGAGDKVKEITPDKAMSRILDNNATVKLANGWTIKKSLVAGEPRVEIKGVDSFSAYDELVKQGAFKERINYDTRVFIPAGEEGVKVLDRITKSKPITDIQVPKGEASVTFGSGFGALQDSYEALAKLTSDKIKEAIPHLEAIGNSIYEKGMKYGEFVSSMKAKLGDMWDRFKSQMIKVYQAVNAKFSEERGSFSSNEKSDIIPSVADQEGKGNIPTATTLKPGGSEPTTVQDGLTKRSDEGNIAKDRADVKTTDLSRPAEEAGQSPMFSRAVQPTQEEQKGISERAASSLKDFASFLSPLGKLANKDQYITERYLALGKIGESEEIGKNIYTSLKSAGEHSESIYKYLTDTEYSEDNIKDTKLREVAVSVKTKINEIGKGLVERGIIPEASFKKYEGRYLPRLYLKYVLEGVGSDMGTGRKPSTMGYAKQRDENLDESIRQILGEIKDPAYLASRAILIPSRDMAIIDWFEKIAQVKDWALPKQMAEWNGRKVTPYWLKSEAEAIRERSIYMAEKDRAEVLETAQKMEDLANKTLEAAGIKKDEIPAEYKQVPNNRRYGALRGLIVRQEIFEDIVGATHIQTGNQSIAESLLGYGGKLSKATSLWKWAKVAANPPAQVRNFVSNMVLLNLSGVRFDKVPVRMFQAIKEINNGGKHWDIAKKYGVTKATFASEEMSRINKELLDMEARLQGKTMSWRHALNLFNQLRDKTSDWYQFMESVGKTAKIIDMMEKGATEKKAAMEAHDWLFDYSLVPSSVRYLRNAPIGIPFMTFQYKVLTKFAKEMKENPVRFSARFVPYAVMAYTLPAIVASMSGVDDDDLEKLKLALPEWLQEKGHTYFLPYKDSAGRWQAVDLGYFFPWTSFREFGKEVYKGEMWKAMESAGVLGGPIPDIMAAIQTNRDPFTRKEIVDQYSTPSEQLGQMIFYLYRLGMPTWLTDIGAGGKLVQAMSRTVDKYGEPKTTIGQAFGRFAGVNVYGVEPTRTRIENLNRMEFEIQELKRRRTMIGRDRNMTLAEKKKEADYITDMIRKRAVKMMQYARDSRVNPALVKK